MLMQIDNSEIKSCKSNGGQVEIVFENGVCLRAPYTLAIFISRFVEARGAGNIAKLNNVNEAVGDMLLETLLGGFNDRIKKLTEENKSLKQELKCLRKGMDLVG